MKIGFISPHYAPYRGGVETLVQSIAERIASWGHRTEVLALDSTGTLPAQEEINRVMVRRFREWSPGDVYHVGLSMLSYLRAHRDDYDIVNAHNYHAMPLLWSSIIYNDRLVASPHYHGHGHTALANLLHPFYRPFGRWAVRRAQRVICATRAERALLLSHLGISKNRIAIVSNGIPLDQLRSARPLELTGVALVYVGRLMKYKRVDRAVAALAHLPQDYHLYVIGVGPEKAALEEQAQEAGVAHRVTFLTDVSDDELFRWYRSAQVLVMMSEAESFPMTSLEAMAGGSRVVCGPFPPFVELAARFPQDMLVVNDASDQALAERIRTAAETPGRVEADLNDFSWDVVARTTLAVFESVIASKG